MLLVAAIERSDSPPHILIFPVQLTTSRIGNLTRLVDTTILLHVWPYIRPPGYSPIRPPTVGSKYYSIRYRLEVRLAVKQSATLPRATGPHTLGPKKNILGTEYWWNRHTPVATSQWLGDQQKNGASIYIEKTERKLKSPLGVPRITEQPRRHGSFARCVRDAMTQSYWPGGVVEHIMWHGDKKVASEPRTVLRCFSLYRAGRTVITLYKPHVLHTPLEHPPNRTTFYMLLSRRKLHKCV